jgi:hypothetical protein
VGIEKAALRTRGSCKAHGGETVAGFQGIECNRLNHVGLTEMSGLERVGSGLGVPRIVSSLKYVKNTYLNGVYNDPGSTACRADQNEHQLR